MAVLPIDSLIIGVHKQGSVLRIPRSMVAFPELLLSDSILGNMYRENCIRAVADVVDLDMLNIYGMPAAPVENVLDQEVFEKWLKE